jgi:DNA-binding MarR family transcriptional regulator
MQRDRATTPDLAEELRATLGRLVRRLRAEPGPPVPQLTVLGRIDRHGPASISELADGERMRPQSMAQTVRELEAAGLVSRRADPDDRRRMFVDLTPAGLETLRATRARRSTWLAETLEHELAPSERELLRDAIALLDRIAAH